MNIMKIKNKKLKQKKYNLIILNLYQILLMILKQYHNKILKNQFYQKQYQIKIFYLMKIYLQIQKIHIQVHIIHQVEQN